MLGRRIKCTEFEKFARTAVPTGELSVPPNMTSDSSRIQGQAEEHGEAGKQDTGAAEKHGKAKGDEYTPPYGNGVATLSCTA